MHDLERSAARLLVIGFPGRTLDAKTLSLVERGVSGLVLFSRNVGSAREVFELTRAAKRHAGRPLVVAVDQEGGKVARLREGFTPLPPFAVLGKTADTQLARAYGGLIAAELAAVGIDWNFAPVLDVDTNPGNPVIGERSLGPEAALVAELGAAFAAGLEAGGVAACAKHFPGHGDTRQDSHLTLPRLPHALDRLRAVELLPFGAAVKANVASIMTAHVVFEALEPRLPATMSRGVVAGILRDELGYRGLVVTDDLEMKAIADHFPIEDVVVRGLEAGIDAFLCCNTAELAERALRGIVSGVKSGLIPEGRLAVASERMARFTERWASAPREEADLSVLASPRHLALVDGIRARAEAS